MFKKEDTYSYRGWLASDFILKRALAVYGHYLVASLILSAVMMVFALIIILLLWALNTLL